MNLRPMSRTKLEVAVAREQQKHEISKLDYLDIKRLDVEPTVTIYNIGKSSPKMKANA